MKNRSTTNRNANKNPKRRLINLAFISICVGLLLILYLAPEETTTPLPKDDVHLEFHRIESKKEADALCFDCHSPEGGMELPGSHPDPYRCLFCHKR